MIRQFVRRLKRAFEKDGRSGPVYGADGFLYPWANQILTEMIDAGHRPPYAWGALQGASLAAALGIKRISIVEFGVAGGTGLVSLERIAEHIEGLVGVAIDIYGFDRGVGMPGSTDNRDVPNLTSAGLYAMDEEKLRGKLCRSRLILGDIQSTIGEFLSSKPAPLAFLACDVVLYTSTVHALRILDGEESTLLPRVHCYFDDVLGFTYGDCNGERLAIHEFNAAHPKRKISPIYGLKHYLPTQCFNEMWAEKYWIAHAFDHSMYGARDGLVKGHNLSLRGQ